MVIDHLPTQIDGEPLHLVALVSEIHVLTSQNQPTCAGEEPR